MAYTKLDAGITDSTIWQAPDATRLVWITMLAMADQNGYVGASMPGLAGRARVALDACIAAVATLEAPDEWSRTKEHEGRRIAPADGGWVLLNHAKYRAMQSADDRRERSRIAMAELRAKRKQESTKVNGEHVLTKLPEHESKLSQAEAEAENTNTSGFALFWSQWPAGPRKTAKKQCEAKWVSQGCEPSQHTIRIALDYLKSTEQWKKDGGAFIPAPLTWLNRRGWEFEVPKATNCEREASDAWLEKHAADKLASQTPQAKAARELALKAIRRVP